MVDWDLAGNIAAVVAVLYLPFILSPTAYGALERSGRWLAKGLWPAGSYCRCLSWDDVPEGKIHECPNSTRSYPFPFHTDCFCPAESLQKTFTKAFAAPNGRQKFVEKPKQLAFNRRYVRTDAMTLLAFIFSSTNDTISSHDINLETIDTISIASVHCAGRIRSDVTKKTLEGIIAGYPPWYRERLVVAHGPVVPHPIQNRDDIYRAGWVVSVGLSKTEPLPQLVRDKRSIYEDDHYEYRPVKRVLEKMRDDIQPHFPGNQTLKAAISAVEYLIQRQTGSGVERYLTPELHKDLRDIHTSPLSGSDCVFAMSLFNKVGNLSEADRRRLSPIMTPVLDAAFRGSYQVVQHCKNGNTIFWIPPALENFKRPIYIDLGRDD